MDDLQSPLIQPTDVAPSPVQTSEELRVGRKSWFTMSCILVTVCLERAAYYTLLGNLAVFLNAELLCTPYESSVFVLAFYGLTWVSCFVGGILGDVVLGRFSTISVGLVLYTIGYVSLPIISFLAHSGKEMCQGDRTILIWISITLLVISLGEGLFKANMAPFGADQMARSVDRNLRSFFSFFYWSINIGGFIGYGPMSYLLEHGSQKGFTIGYIVGVCIIALAGVVFMMPKRYLYSVARPRTNILRTIFQVIKDALKNRRKKQGRERTGAPSYEDFVPHQHWLDRAMIKYGGKHLDIEVEEVKSLFSVMPVFGFLIIYCALYYQISGTFLLQGLNMATTFRGSFSMPAAWLSLFNIVFVVIFVPIVDKGLYPCLEKCKIKVSYKMRMAIGIIIASGAMVAAGFVEMKRVQVGSVNVTINGNTKTASNMTIFYQVPQYALIGISEIFVLITGLEFAYTNSPKSMQSLVTGLFFMANGIGSFLGLTLLVIAGKLGYGFSFKDGSSNPLAKLEGKLYYFFFFLAALNAANWICFLIYTIVCHRRSRSRSKRTVERFLKDSGALDWKSSSASDYPPR